MKWRISHSIKIMKPGDTGQHGDDRDILQVDYPQPNAHPFSQIPHGHLPPDHDRTLSTITEWSTGARPSITRTKTVMTV
jgi:hypothetical protein